MLLVYIAAAWIAGLVVAAQVSLPPLAWALWLVVPAGMFLVWRKDERLRRVHFYAFVFVLAALRWTVPLGDNGLLPSTDERALARLNDRGARAITGDVVEPPTVRDRTASVRLAVTRVRVDGEWRDATGVALLQVPRETDLRYGDRIEVYGEPETPAEFEDFSYKDYLARQGIHSIIRSYGAVRILARDQGQALLNVLVAFRDRALATVDALFPEPAAALLAGILLGVDSGIPQEVQDAFSATNTAHIVAISGFNIAIVAGMLSQLAQRLTGSRTNPSHRRRGLTTALVLAGLVLYTALVGAGPSVVRAAWMGALSVLAVYYRRQNDALTALGASALAMTAWSPAVLFDLGFQLSFLATLGLILYTGRMGQAVERRLARWMSNERARQATGLLGDSLIVTLAAQLTTMPLLLLAFHRLSLVGLAANLLVLPAQPPLMILGGLATILGMVLPPVGQVIAWAAWAFLEWTLLIVRTMAQLPNAALDVGRFDTPLLVLYYAVLFGATRLDWRTWQAELKLRPAVALGLTAVVGLWGWNLAITAPDGRAHAAFLDAGSAATLVRTPQGKTVLVDGGTNPSVVLAALGDTLPFWERSLDLVVLTRADDDHLAGLVPVLERYTVKQVIEAPAPDKPGAAYVKWRELIAAKGIVAVPARAGLVVELERGMELAVLSPEEGSGAKKALVRLVAGNVSFLFADNSTVEEQQELLDAAAVAASGDPDVASTVLVVPRQVAADLVERVDPRLAVLFAGGSARDEPSPDLLAALSSITLLRTDKRGRIDVVVDGAGLRVGAGR